MIIENQCFIKVPYKILAYFVGGQGVYNLSSRLNFKSVRGWPDINF